MPLIIRHASEESTGKYQTASERGEERTVEQGGNESTERVHAASEKDAERTFTSDTEVGPRHKVEDHGPRTFVADSSVTVEEVSDKKAVKAEADGAKVVESGEAEDKAVRSSSTKRTRKKA